MAMPGSRFLGFDTGDAANRRFTGVPATFFTQLLPQITNLNELKVLLHLMYLAGQKRGDPKWVGYWELERSPELLSGLGRPGDPRPPQEHLREGLELCVSRGTLLRLVAAPAPNEFALSGELEPVLVTWFLLNTSTNRDFVLGLEEGKTSLEDTTLLQGLDIWEWTVPSENATGGNLDPRAAIERWKELRLNSARPDIYTLYEQNISVLTPLMSERLREAEKLYPAEWVEAAFKHAVTYNRRNWAYISKILETWASEGPGENNQQEGYYGREGQQSARRSGRTGNERAGLAGSRTGEAGAQSEANGQELGAAGFSPPDRGGRPGARPTPSPSKRPAERSAEQPIDFAKYTTGKYAYLSQPRRDKPFPEGDDSR